MTLHKVIAYVRYRWNAKGRHGTHSPFVYHFVENRLRARVKKPLEQFLHEYFGKDLQISTLPISELKHETDATVIAIRGIRNTREHTKEWEKLKAHHKVTMSIDLFDFGLLLFRKDFLEKQHFTLKA